MMIEDERIYVVVPAVVFKGKGRDGPVKQPLGRQAAQAAHVVSKMRVYEAAKQSKADGSVTWRSYTTIILSARDANEMGHVWTLLSKKKIAVQHFSDTNPEYGTASLVTAICTWPVTKKQVEGILDYLPLWDEHAV
jgi:Peptidyl-tRNA hydrolase PTH2